MLNDGELTGEDYLGKVVTPEIVKDLLEFGAEKLRDMKRGMHGYKKRHQIFGVTILSDGGEVDMGTHVSITGDPLKLLPLSPFEIMARVVAAGGKFTRIDIAIDDFSGLILLDEMIKICRRGHLASKLHRYSVQYGGFTSTGAETGKTLYIGRRQSDVYFRIYDKWLEQRYEHDVPESSLPPGGWWKRAEAETHGAAANNLAAELLKTVDVTATIKGVFANYLNFKAPAPGSRETKKSRLPTAPFWRDFLAEVDKLKIARTVRPSNFYKKMRWFKKQCLPTMALVGTALGSGGLTELCAEGLYRMQTDPAAVAAAEEYREKLKAIKAKIQKGLNDEK